MGNLYFLNDNRWTHMLWMKYLFFWFNLCWTSDDQCLLYNMKAIMKWKCGTCGTDTISKEWNACLTGKRTYPLKTWDIYMWPVSSFESKRQQPRSVHVYTRQIDRKQLMAWCTRCNLSCETSMIRKLPAKFSKSFQFYRIWALLNLIHTLASQN